VPRSGWIDNIETAGDNLGRAPDPARFNDKQTITYG